MKQVYSFTAEDLTATSDASQSPEQTEVPTLSLLESVHSLVATGSLVQYHFLHLSFQELCAAYHVSRLPDPEKTHSDALRNLRMSNFHTVCNFYSALTRLKILNTAKRLESKFVIYNDIFFNMIQRKAIDLLTHNTCDVNWESKHFFLTHYDENYDAIVMNGRSYIKLFFFKFLMESENPSFVDAMIGKELRVNITTDTERTFTAVIRNGNFVGNCRIQSL